jgi:hypothetical protein
VPDTLQAFNPNLVDTKIDETHGLTQLLYPRLPMHAVGKLRLNAKCL